MILASFHNIWSASANRGILPENQAGASGSSFYIKFNKPQTSCLYETCATSHSSKTLPNWADRKAGGRRLCSRETPLLAHGQAPQVSQKHSVFGELKFSRHFTSTQQLAFPLHHRSTSQQYMRNQHRYIAIEFTIILFGRPHINISSVRAGGACRKSKICNRNALLLCGGRL